MDFTNSHGSGEGASTNQHESTRIQIRGNPCQSVDKTSTDSKETPCLSNSVTSAFCDSNPPALTTNDVVRGYRLEAVRTNAAVPYARPANARLVGTWHLTDAYRGRAWARLGEEGKGKKEEVRRASPLLRKPRPPDSTGKRTVPRYR